MGSRLVPMGSHSTPALSRAGVAVRGRMMPSALDCATALSVYTPAVPPLLVAREAYQF